MNDSAGRIWIQGAGELASGVAFRLFRSGYQIIMAEIANPLAVRRLVCFCEAVYEGTATVEGIPGQLVSAQETCYEPQRITVLIDPDGQALSRLGASAVIDARITKRTPVPLPRGQAPLIGLGPGFTCGVDADLIIETHRGARLGEVISLGTAAENTGIPGVLGGQSLKRVVRAPAAGHFHARVQLGDLVSAGQVLGEVAGVPVASEIEGQVRGLVHPRAELSAGEKVGDVDPRGLAIDPRKVSDKALAIGGGVLEALLRLRILPEASQH
jgi:xanthine dehydrogenase accessory factor